MRFADSIIDEAISLNWERLNEPRVREWKLGYGPAAFLREFATVSLNIGRMGGYTSYIHKHALSCDLILVHKQDWVKEFHRGHIYTLRQLTQHKSARGKMIEKVWVDNASVVLDTEQKKMEFYLEVAGFNPNQIIMLG